MIITVKSPGKSLSYTHPWMRALFRTLDFSVRNISIFNSAWKNTKRKSSHWNTYIRGIQNS